MSDIVKPGAGLLFMKVGTHAQESLEDIIERKAKEIDDAGYGMWGYGGNTCHPRSMVQPFAQSFEDKGQPIHLVMEEMDSKHFAEPLRADEYSVDGINWAAIPTGINVLGSRYALVIGSLDKNDAEIELERTRVPIGPSMGRLGSRYVKGRVDKACLEVLPESERVNDAERRVVKTSLSALLKPPYAVFLRNRSQS